MSWTYLTNLLTELARRSTAIGKYWVTLVTLLRIVITEHSISAVYADEQSAFTCNTKQPGCVTLCYSAFAPISHLRFWQAQIYGIILPIAIYLVYAMQKLARKQPKVEEPEREALLKPSSGRRRIMLDGLMTAYTVQLLARAAMDAVFLFAQYKMFGVVVPPIYECTVPRCEDTLTCFVSRPDEKTNYLIFTYFATAVCLFLTVLEFCYLVLSCVRDSWKGTSGNGHGNDRAPRDIEEGNEML